MNPVFEWGIEFIATVQQIGGATGFTIAEFFTFLGNQEFYLLLFPLFFWSLDRAMGARLAIIYLLSVYGNTAVKDIIDQPRPYELAPAVAPPDPDAVYGGGHGMPSGHAQWSMTIWGMIAIWVRKPWFWAIAMSMTLLIGFSRIYLGVHFPSQVAAGWGSGLVVLALYMIFYAPLEQWLARLNLTTQIALAILLPAVLMLTHPVPDIIAAMAVLAGFGVGLAIAEKQIPYTVYGSWSQRASRYVVGIVVLLMIYFGLSAVFPEEGATLYVPLRIVRYTLVGAWISLGAPWLFTRAHLVQSHTQPV